MALARTLIFTTTLPLDPCNRPEQWETHYSEHGPHREDPDGVLWALLWHLCFGDPFPGEVADEPLLSPSDISGALAVAASSLLLEVTA